MSDADTRYAEALELATSEELDASTRAFCDQSLNALRDAFARDGVDIDDPAQRRAAFVTLFGTLDALRTLRGLVWINAHPDVWNAVALNARLLAELELAVRGSDWSPRHHGGATELAAATSIRTGTQRAAVLAAIARAGHDGRTDYELERQLGIKRPSPGNRRGELVDAGYVEDSGRTRPTDTGHAAVVWVATDEGYRKAHELRTAD